MREITKREALMIGLLIGEPFVMAGHPLTCNGGNNDQSTHHDHKVNMMIELRKEEDSTVIELHCPECSRIQYVGVMENQP